MVNLQQEQEAYQRDFLLKALKTNVYAHGSCKMWTTPNGSALPRFVKHPGSFSLIHLVDTAQALGTETNTLAAFLQALPLEEQVHSINTNYLRC